MLVAALGSMLWRHANFHTATVWQIFLYEPVSHLILDGRIDNEAVNGFGMFWVCPMLLSMCTIWLVRQQSAKKPPTSSPS